MVNKILTVFTLVVIGLFITVMGVWGTMAILIVEPISSTVTYLLASLFALASSLAWGILWFKRLRWRGMGAYGVVLMLFFMWYTAITPSNDRVWQENVALLPYTTQDKNLITFHNIRNFTYRSENDYTPNYYDKTFDIEHLIGVDVITVYWMGPAVAHVFLSFEFDDGEHLAVSIETRMEEGEQYSPLKGFFRQYELYYVVADERDVIGLRTNYRFNPVEDLYIYPMEGTLEDAHNLFLSYIAKINALKEKPEFYNTLTTNCTTNIWVNAQANIKHIPFSWKILVSGYVPEYLYEQGRLKANGRSFEQLREDVHANDRALKYGINTNFSKHIRE